MPGIVRGQVVGGDLFVTNGLGGPCNSSGGSSIFQYAKDTQPGPSPTPSFFAGNLDEPRALAFDSAGNLFVTSNPSDNDCNVVGTIFKITPDGLMSTFATLPFNRWVNGLAIDSANDVFVDGGDNINASAPSTIYKITPDGSVSSFAVTPTFSYGIAIDSADNVYSVTWDGNANNNNEILKFDSNGTQVGGPFVGPTEFPSPPAPGPFYLTFDNSSPQNLFVTVTSDDGTGEIRRYDSHGTEIMPRFATGLTNFPRGLVFDAAGDLFVTESGAFGVFNAPVDILEFTPGGTGTVPGITPAPGFGVAKLDQGTARRGVGWGPQNPTFTTGTVTPVNTAVTVTFPAGTSAETTTVTPIASPSATPSPSEFQLGSPPLAFDITASPTPTTAPIIIAFQVPQSFLDQCGCDVSTLRVLHGTALEDVTCPLPNPGPTPNPTTRTVYASVSSLSPFVIAKLRYGAQVQQPINADGSSVFNARRGVIPVKFTLTQDGASTCALSPAIIAVTRTAGGTTGAINESVYSGSSDNGSSFRISSCQYVYNLNSGALGAGTYRIDIKINGTVVGSAFFQLK